MSGPLGGSLCRQIRCFQCSITLNNNADLTKLVMFTRLMKYLGFSQVSPPDKSNQIRYDAMADHSFWYIIRRCCILSHNNQSYCNAMWSMLDEMPSDDILRFALAMNEKKAALNSGTLWAAVIYYLKFSLRPRVSMLCRTGSFPGDRTFMELGSQTPRHLSEWRSRAVLRGCNSETLAKSPLKLFKTG